jgi:hypothetical protein
MAKPRKGVMPPALKAYWAKKRRATKAGSNPARRTKSRHHRKATRRTAAVATVTHRRARRNPPSGGGAGFLGIFPPLADIGAVSAGVLAPSLVSGQVFGLVPSLRDNPVTYWATKLGAAIAPGWLARKFVSRRFGDLMTVASVSMVVVDAARSYFPGLSGQPLLGYMTPGMIARVPGSGQPTRVLMPAAPITQPRTVRRLGYVGTRQNAAASRSAINAGIPARLDPSNRF